MAVDDAATVAARHDDQFALDIDRHWTDTLRPPVRKIAGAIVTMTQPGRQRLLVRLVVVANHDDVAIAEVAIAVEVSIIAIVPIVPVVPMVVAFITDFVAVVAVPSPFVSSFRVTCTQRPAKQCNSEHD